MTDIAKGENAIRVFMMHNVENTASWEDKAGNTQNLDNSKLASPNFLILAPHFSAFTINKLQIHPFESFTLVPFEKMLGSRYPEFVHIHVFMGVHETINNNHEDFTH